jgi:hypothetical protein
MLTLLACCCRTAGDAILENVGFGPGDQTILRPFSFRFKAIGDARGT